MAILMYERFQFSFFCLNRIQYYLLGDTVQYTGSCLKKKIKGSILFYDFFSKLMIFTKKAYTIPKISAQVSWCTKCNFCDNTCKVIQSRSVFLAVKMYQITNLH